LAHVVSNLIGSDRLTEQVENVLDTLVPAEREVQTTAGAWYILAIRPYRTLENVIDGAVVTFVDITDHKAAQEKLVEAERFRRASEIESVGIVFFRIDGTLMSANDAFFRLTGYREADLAAGNVTWEHLTAAESSESGRRALKDVLSAGRSIPLERAYIRKDGSRGWALFAAWRMDGKEAVMYVIDLAHKNSQIPGGSEPN
jgi:PAS domain S-box-containing protein